MKEGALPHLEGILEALHGQPGLPEMSSEFFFE